MNAKTLGIGLLAAVLIVCSISMVSDGSDAADSPSITDIDYSSETGVAVVGFDADPARYTVIIYDGTNNVGQRSNVYVSPCEVPLRNILEPGDYTVSIIQGNDTDNVVMSTSFHVWTVQFDVNGGNGTAPEMVYATGTYALPDGQGLTGPDGEDFLGWSTSPDGPAIVGDYEVTGDVVLYAVYDDGTAPENVTVTFDSNGGSAVAPVTVQAGQSIQAPEAPTMADHTFDGWYTQQTGGDMITFPYEVNESITLYAHWTPVTVTEEYTVTFLPNGAEGSEYTQTIEAGVETALNANTFTRTGWTFIGWNTDADGNGTSYTDGQTVTLTDDLILYAQWEEDAPEEWTVTVSAGEGGTASPTGPQTVTDGGNLTVKFTPGEGYEVSAILVDDQPVQDYEIGADGSVTYTLSGISADIALSAEFEPMTFSITLSTNGQDGWYDLSAETIEYGGSVTLQVIPPESHTYELEITGELYETSGLETDTITISEIMSDIEITLNFTVREFSVVVDPDIIGGTVTPSATSVEYGGTLTLTATPGDDMRLFSMTVTVGDGEPVTYNQSEVTVTVTGVVTVTAEFEPAVGPEPERYDVTLSYDEEMGSVNGPSGADAIVEGNDARYTITANDGYVIVSYTVDDGDTVLLDRVASWSGVILEDVAANHTITVEFAEAEQYTVTVDTGIQNGSVRPLQTTVYEGRSVTLIVTPDPYYELESLTVNGEDLTDGVSNGRITIASVHEDLEISAEFVRATVPVPDDDDEEYIPPDITVVTDDEDNTTTYIVAIAAGVVVAILAALILMQARKS